MVCRHFLCLTPLGYFIISNPLKPIYAILSNVLHGFAPQLPGPKSAEESRLLDRIATLDATNRLLQRENEQLHRCLRQSVEVTPERLKRLLLTGIGEMLPYETIQTIVSVAYRPLKCPQRGTLKRVSEPHGDDSGADSQ